MAAESTSKKRPFLALASKNEDDTESPSITKVSRRSLTPAAPQDRTPFLNHDKTIVSAAQNPSLNSSNEVPRSKLMHLHYRNSSPGKGQPIDSFFLASQRRSLPLSQSKLPTPPQHEDLEDLIEDTFSEDDIMSDNASAPSMACMKPTRNSIPQLPSRETSATRIHDSLGKAKTSWAASKDRRSGYEGCSSSPRDCHHFTLSEISAVAKKSLDSRPWSERFAPKSSFDLAVNPKKVSEVRSWLEHVLDGFSKKRLLVLNGSAGTGKTATISVLSKELGFEILEWKNPGGAIRGDVYENEGAFSTGLAGVFEEFMGRAGRFGSLNMTSTSSFITAPKSARRSAPSSNGKESKKIILIEDFPNALFTSSSTPLAAFRHTIKSFLTFASLHRSALQLPPLVLIISETASFSGPSAFTAHRLLSSEILHHPLTTSVTFNKIAPTFMLKALSAIMAQEHRESYRKLGPSKPLLEALATSGDVRSAIMCLEFLAVDGGVGAFSEPATFTKKKKQKLRDRELNDIEREMLIGVTQRESRLGIFHAVGKVVHNKRYGDDVEDPYVPPPPRPLLKAHAWRNRASKVDISCLMDEAGMDAQTLISGFHENYIGSCNFLGGFSPKTHSVEELLDCTNSCLEGLSDSDLLATPRPYHPTLGIGRARNYEGLEGSSGAGLRLDEISFQVAVRCIILALPSPVKRDAKDNKMFYPTALKLWRDKQEIESMLDLFVRKFSLSGDESVGGGGVLAAGRSEMLLERLPYLKIVTRAQQQKIATSRSLEATSNTRRRLIEELEAVTSLKGIHRQSEEIPDEDLVGGRISVDELEAAEEQKKGISRMAADIKLEAHHGKKREMKDKQWASKVAGIETLLLSDDDIEDDW